MIDIFPRIFPLAATAFLTVGCIDNGVIEEPVPGQSKPSAYRSEFYNPDGSIWRCIRYQHDNEGYIERAISSHQWDNSDAVLTCSDEDIHQTVVTYSYSADRKSFTTSGQSNFDPSPLCIKIQLYEQGTYDKKEWYQSSMNDYTCSVETGKPYIFVDFVSDDGVHLNEAISYHSGQLDYIREIDLFIFTWSDFKWDDNPHFVTIYNYSAKGDDGIWKTDDDLLSSYEEDTYKSDGVFDSGYTYSVGDDQIPHTIDDIVTGYRRNFYEGDVLKREVKYSSPGDDGIWETIEDNSLESVYYY